jgi:hypothetical protein
MARSEDQRNTVNFWVILRGEDQRYTINFWIISLHVENSDRFSFLMQLMGFPRIK